MIQHSLSREVAIATVVVLRDGFTAAELRRLAQSRHDAGQVRRLLALAAIYDGGRRSEAARIGGVGLQTVRDWVQRFTRDGPDGLVDGKSPGGRPRLDATQRAAAVKSGPIPAAHGVVRWRLVDLAAWVHDEFAVSISTQTLSRELRAMGYRKLTARPRHHAQDADAIPAFRNKYPPRWQRSGRRSPRDTPIELWWQDEARVGQKNGITPRWARRRTRPSAPRDQRTTSAYIYGAICPAERKGAALVLPCCNAEGMTLHLAGIAAAVAPGAYAVLLLDQAGWHLSAGLIVPGKITLLPLPAKCPELNRQANVWQFRRDNWLSNRIFKPCDDILDHCCFAWNRLVDQPWRIMSIGRRQWAHG